MVEGFLRAGLRIVFKNAFKHPAALYGVLQRS